MLRMIRHLPFVKILLVFRLALLARRHLGRLSPSERKRAAELVRRGRRLTPAERSELRGLALKLEPRAFTAAAANHLLPLPRWALRIIGLEASASSSRSR
jgi:hypothetical protein